MKSLPTPFVPDTTRAMRRAAGVLVLAGFGALALWPIAALNSGDAFADPVPGPVVVEPPSAYPYPDPVVRPGSEPGNRADPCGCGE